jgi:hypothetical protein
MSQFEVVILNWIVCSVFQKGYTKPFIQHQSVVSLEHIAVIPDYGVLIIVLFYFYMGSSLLCYDVIDPSCHNS